MGAVAELRARVESDGACALPGVSVKYDSFMPVMWQAVARGFVDHDKAVFVGDGRGVALGVQGGDRRVAAGDRWPPLVLQLPIFC